MENINIYDLLNDLQDYDKPCYITTGKYKIIDYINDCDTLVVEIYNNDFLSTTILDFINSIDYMVCTRCRNGFTKSCRYIQYDYCYNDTYYIYLRFYNKK